MTGQRSIPGGRQYGTRMSVALTMLLFLVTVLATSCTTASYGNKFVSDAQVVDQYSFKIYVGGFQFAPPETQAEKRITEFMVGKDYTKYEVIKKRFNKVPSYYEFTVKFAN